MADQAQKVKETARQAKDKAQEVADQAEHKAEEVGAQARQKAAQAADQMGQKAEEAASALGQQAGQMAQAQVERRKHRVAEGVHTVGEALRLGAQQLRQRGEPKDTQYVERLAGQVDRVSGFLERGNTREMARDVEHFARQNQALFLSGTFALGLLGARFLKSSPTEEVRKIQEEGWTLREQTARVPEPEHDAVGRPKAPGYKPPSERATSASDKEAAGPREA
jgi:hypothetical protein